MTIKADMIDLKYISVNLCYLFIYKFEPLCIYLADLHNMK